MKSIFNTILPTLQSTEYRDSSITKTENLTDVDGIRSSGLSADDSPELFCEDSGKLNRIRNNAI